jgi:uncharacterized protein (UPF0332 family)
MNPEHLLEQADNLINTTNSGAPRQADLKRAVSAAYYALFHYVMRAACDFVLGKTAARDDLYARTYRDLQHGELKTRSTEARGVSNQIKAFADTIVTLQVDRHNADYHPLFKISKADALAKVGLARAAIASFQAANEDHQKAYLVTVLFQKRS